MDDAIAVNINNLEILDNNSGIKEILKRQNFKIKNKSKFGGVFCRNFRRYRESYWRRSISCLFRNRKRGDIIENLYYQKFLERNYECKFQ